MLTDNRWDRVPNKDSIEALEIVAPWGTTHLLEAPKDKKVAFFAQRIGYTMQVRGRVVNVPYAGDQVGMFINVEGDCEILEVEKTGEKRYCTNLKGLGFNKLSLEMLGIDLEKVFA